MASIAKHTCEIWHLPQNTMPFNEKITLFFLVIKEMGSTKKITTTGDSTQGYKTEAFEFFSSIA